VKSDLTGSMNRDHVAEMHSQGILYIYAAKAISVDFELIPLYMLIEAIDVASRAIVKTHFHSHFSHDNPGRLPRSIPRHPIHSRDHEIILHHPQSPPPLHLWSPSRHPWHQCRRENAPLNSPNRYPLPLLPMTAQF